MHISPCMHRQPCKYHGTSRSCTVTLHVLQQMHVGRPIVDGRLMARGAPGPDRPAKEPSTTSVVVMGMHTPLQASRLANHTPAYPITYPDPVSASHPRIVDDVMVQVMAAPVDAL